MSEPDMCERDMCERDMCEPDMCEPDIVVQSGAGAYPIRFLDGEIGELAEALVSTAPGRRLHGITDEVVDRLHGRALRAALAERGADVTWHAFPAGEAHKSIATVSTLWDAILAGPVERGDVVVAFGGGVVGDVAGFVAATLLRGLPVIQSPTTVLAMADAAIGGKTGVNTSAGKNLVGSFHPPLAVIGWAPVLGTLGAREVASGLAEVVKSAMIDGPVAFESLEADAAALAARAPDALLRAVRMAAALKARIVSGDERESGPRRLLNFGHTFGHAIEHARGYGAWTHGEAVAAGMVVAARYAEDAGLCAAAEVERLVRLLASMNLPVEPPPITMDAWMQPIFRDKKRVGGAVDLVLTRGPGRCEVRRVEYEALEKWFETRGWLRRQA